MSGAPEPDLDWLAGAPPEPPARRRGGPMPPLQGAWAWPLVGLGAVATVLWLVLQVMALGPAGSTPKAAPDMSAAPADASTVPANPASVPSRAPASDVAVPSPAPASAQGGQGPEARRQAIERIRRRVQRSAPTPAPAPQVTFPVDGRVGRNVSPVPAPNAADNPPPSPVQQSQPAPEQQLKKN